MLVLLGDCLASITLQTWLIFIIIFMLAYNYLKKQQWKNLPPGPPALPLVGSMPFLGADIRAPLLKMAKKYGNVFSIYMGSTRVVVLSGYEAIRDAFAKSGNAFSGRPPLFFVEHITMGYGIVSSQGAFWQEQRRHTMHILRNFGVGRTIIEDRILEEVGFFIKAMRDQTGVAYNPHPLIQASVANVIAAVTFGKRYDYDDPLFKKYMKNTTDSFEVLGNSGVLTVFPFLRHIPGDLIGYKKLMVIVDFMMGEYQRMIDEHKARFDVTKEPTDVIDAYLKTMEDVKDDPDTTFTDKQLQHMIGDLFGAGTETSATTLAWGLVYMTRNSDIQSKVQAEIDEVLGKDDLPSMSHRTKMPYTEACLAEIQRLGDIVPLGVPHSTTEDITFRGFFIPIGTMIIPNMNSIHMDPDLWEEPERFDPGRFLDEDGHFVKREELIPFSIGKRVCLGEGLARMELFLYFVSMMQNFEFRVHPDHPPPDTHGILSITNIPKPYKILVTERK